MVDLDGRARRKLRRDEYDQMVIAGMLDGKHVELIRGELVAMSPIGSAHSAVVTALYERLLRCLGPAFVVRCQQPLVCADESEPEPDLAVVTRRRYRDAHPTAAALVIEVAETSLAYDLSAKATLYADSDVDEYWVIDLGRSLVHVHRGRTGGRWTSITTLGADDHIASIGLAGSSFTLAEVLRDA
jgi:Uma2 family endonuclease